MTNYLRLLDEVRGEVLGREGSVSPMCGRTLSLGKQHKNNTRQPTVYSYTTSHRSPLFRVDSPTHYRHHSHDHYHPDSQQSCLSNNSKHAISCNRCRATSYQTTPRSARIVVCLLL